MARSALRAWRDLWLQCRRPGSGSGAAAAGHPARPAGPPMEAFLVSTGLVALAEIGDKTLLLALVMAVRFNRPGAIILAILAATLANHALAGLLGIWLAGIGGDWLRWLVALSFFAMAAWVLVPDQLDVAGSAAAGERGAFLTTLVCFFVAEIGDKTEVATVALAARFDTLAAVVGGTTLGMMIANLPAVLLGGRIGPRCGGRRVRLAAASAFVLLGI